MAASTFKIYTIEGIDYDAIIAKYRQICIDGEWDTDTKSISVYGNVEPKYNLIREPREPLMDDTRIKRKAIYLVHTIAYRQATNRDNSPDGATIWAKILQGVIYEDYYELVKALEQLGYIKVSPYIYGKSSRRYKIYGSITTIECSDKTIRGYINKAKKLLKKAVLKRLAEPKFKALYGDTFAETYIKNLNKFKVKDEQGFNKYAKEQIALQPTKESYYNFIKESFKNDLYIYSIDGNNRIYHLLTSLERELKQFINIRFSIDCKNSHPLLFNYFIYNSKGISIELSYLISSILFYIDYLTIYSISNNHYDIEKLCNVLISNNIDKSIIAKFAPDELLYIYKTTKGLFWDDILTEHQGEGYDRAEIKQKMFAEVFYSKTPKIAWKEFAKEFKAQYPNVYNLIIRWKEPTKYKDLNDCLLARNKAVLLDGKTYSQNPVTALPNIMMDLESEIFREVLKSLYRKRIPTVHIHDAIVIPDTRAKVDVEQVESVMRDVYKKHGLHPTFSVDKYGE